MRQAEIGINIGDLRGDVKEGLRLASSLDFRVIELPAAGGEIDPAVLGASGRRHLARFADGLGLKLTSLVADFPTLRLTDPRTVEERVDRTCRVIDLAADLRIPVVIASTGAITHPESGEPAPLAVEALKRIGAFADSRRTAYAIRPSYDNGDRLVRVLGEIACPAIGVGLDPAAIVMAGANPLARIEKFIEQIVAVQARDGTVGAADRAGVEAPMGEGDVDWIALLDLLGTADYRNPYVVRRTHSANPVDDLQHAREVLLGMISRER